MSEASPSSLSITTALAASLRFPSPLPWRASPGLRAVSAATAWRRPYRRSSSGCIRGSNSRNPRAKSFANSWYWAVGHPWDSCASFAVRYVPAGSVLKSVWIVVRLHFFELPVPSLPVRLAQRRTASRASSEAGSPPASSASTSARIQAHLSWAAQPVATMRAPSAVTSARPPSTPPPSPSPARIACKTRGQSTCLTSSSILSSVAASLTPPFWSGWVSLSRTQSNPASKARTAATAPARSACVQPADGSASGSTAVMKSVRL
mmetsp:Transcript_29369/g.94040  ORF Transcript_29369/g.94040 Transcript_29369/m.94040 type:complete len:263 (-) Transcript_29369:1356-2144(-)